ncbi:MAG: thiamine pyrophosphate-dependent enzyme, partial [Planctomycetota bacterium]
SDLHTSLGQEIVPVALRTSLTREDWIFSNHRGHAHFLALHEDFKGLMAEIMGREGAVCGGVGGSQHVNVGNFFSTGVQGEGLGQAVGVAHHLKREGQGRLAVAYIGDGTFGQGLVYEALNMAALWNLPLLVVVENNHIAQTTPSHLNMAGIIAARAAAFGIPHTLIDSRDLAEIRAITEPLIAEMRKAPGPRMVEFLVPRLGPHSKGDDTREAHEIAAEQERDWLKHYESQIRGLKTRLEQVIRPKMAALSADLLKKPEIRSLPNG